MDTGAWIGLAVALVAVLLALVITGVVVRFMIRRARMLRHGEPSVRQGPHGQIIDIPVRQISRVPPGAPVIAVARARGIAPFRIHPHGIEYRILRRTSVTFEAITEVDAPFPTQPYFTIRFRDESSDLGVLATSDHAARYALSHLARTCLLTERARARSI
jgi:hypothetical protein